MLARPMSAEILLESGLLWKGPAAQVERAPVSAAACAQIAR